MHNLNRIFVKEGKMIEKKKNSVLEFPKLNVFINSERSGKVNKKFRQYIGDKEKIKRPFGQSGDPAFVWKFAQESMFSLGIKKTGGTGLIF